MEQSAVESKSKPHGILSTEGLIAFLTVDSF